MRIAPPPQVRSWSPLLTGRPSHAVNGRATSPTTMRRPASPGRLTPVAGPGSMKRPASPGRITPVASPATMRRPASPGSITPVASRPSTAVNGRAASPADMRRPSSPGRLTPVASPAMMNASPAVGGRRASPALSRRPGSPVTSHTSGTLPANSVSSTPSTATFALGAPASVTAPATMVGRPTLMMKPVGFQWNALAGTHSPAASRSPSPSLGSRTPMGSPRPLISAAPGSPGSPTPVLPGSPKQLILAAPGSPRPLTPPTPGSSRPMSPAAPGSPRPPVLTVSPKPLTFAAPGGPRPLIGAAPGSPRPMPPAAPGSPRPPVLPVSPKPLTPVPPGSPRPLASGLAVTQPPGPTMMPAITMPQVSVRPVVAGANSTTEIRMPAPSSPVVVKRPPQMRQILASPVPSGRKLETSVALVPSPVPAKTGEVGQLLQALNVSTSQLPGRPRPVDSGQTVEPVIRQVQAAPPVESPQPQAPPAVDWGGLTTALKESRAREAALESSIRDAHVERQELLEELDTERQKKERLAQTLTKVVSTPNHEHLVSQLSYGYRQLQVLQEERMTAQERQRCQAYGQQLVDLEAEVYDRGRELVLARQSVQELETIRVLSNLEQKRCSFLERQLDDQAKVWPWLREKQTQLEEYRQLAMIYHDELQAASEIVEVLQAESQSLEMRLKEETANLDLDKEAEGTMTTSAGGFLMAALAPGTS